MEDTNLFDEDLVRRLPLPLAQLYRRADSAVDPLKRHLAAFDLWEAALLVLATTAIVEYAEHDAPDPQIVERLKNLARPHLGQWWELVRLLVPALAARGDASFRQLSELLLGRTRDDLPRAAGLDAAILDVLGKHKKGSQAVRLQDLFDHLVTYRNKVLAHAAPGQLADDLNQKMARTLLAGMGQILGRVDFLAGRRLLYIADVRQVSGNWLVERFELLGEKARRLEALELPRAAAARLPDGRRVFLEVPGLGPAVERLRALHPLVMYDPHSEQVLFLCGRPGERRTDYLCYTTGLHTERPDLGGEQRELLARVLKMPVDDAQIRQWADAGPDQVSVEASATVIAPRQRTVGEFQLLAKLGQGGMGVVYRAWQPSLRRQVALKVLAGMGNKAEARFHREIQALGRVDHPHVVKVFTSGSDGELWFYAMELVEGVPLSMICERLEARKTPAAAVDLATWRDALSTACEQSRLSETPLSDPQSLPRAATPNLAREASASAPPGLALGRDYPRQIAQLILQVARGAHALHEAGVVHRDIKPGNIMVSANGAHAVLVDLGVAQLADDADGKLTRTRQVVGTLRYASPQQVLAVEKVDRRTDVYSLGVTTWELLTLAPFLGATDETPEPVLMEKIQHDEPAGVRSFHPQVPRDLEAIVQKCLEKDPRRRYQTAEDLAADLERFLSGEAVVARPVGPVRRAFRRAKRRPARTLGMAAALVSLVLLVFGYRYWDAQFRTKVEYYANFAKEYGAPRGIGRVSEAEAAHRFVTWKFTKRGGQVVSCDAVNGRGFPSVEHGMTAFIHRLNEIKRECRYVYKRDADGGLEEEIALDRAGEVVWAFHFSTPTTGYYADKRGIPRARSGTGAAFLEFVFTESGLAAETHFLDKDGNPQANAENVFGFTSRFDERGLEVARTFLDAARRPALDSEGIAGFQLKYDKQGNRIEAVALAADGRPTFHKEGFARWIRTYDPHGNVIEEAYLGIDGKPVVVSAGYAKWVGQYNERGDRVVEEYRGADDKPVLQKDGYARASVRCDERGNPVEGACFGVDGKPTLHRDGFAKWIARYNEHDDPIEKTYFGVDGKPALVKEGYSKWTSRYDEHENHVEAAYFGIDGQPTMCKDGFAKWTARFDERGNRIEEAYFGADGRATLNKDGAARFAYKYDERANLVETAYLGVDGKPIAGKGGRAKMTAKFDERGHRIEDAYFGVNGNPILGRLRCARLTYEYDDRGNWVGTSFFGVDGNPIAIANGYARWTAKYDGQGNRVEESYFAVDGTPATHKNGYARWTAKFDERHNRVEEDYWGTDGKPALVKDGVARWTARYDERGHRFEESYFGVDGKPALNKEGIAKWTARFDERGNEIQMEYFGVDGKPALHREGAAKWTARYDARDNQIEQSFFGLKGQPVVLKDGSAKSTARFDEHGYRLEQAYFGVDGRPMLGNQGAARLTYKYDEFGNCVETAAFGSDGRPIALKDGYAKWNARFNAGGNQLELAYFGIDGKPARIQNGFAKWTSKFDLRGNRTETTFFGCDGAPTVRKEGYARIVCDFDERNLPTKIYYFDAEGKPVTARVVVAAVGSGSLAQRVGLKPGDVLATYDGEPIADWVSFMHRRRTERNRVLPAELKILRGQSTIPVRLPPGPLGATLKDDCRPAAKGTATEPAKPPALKRAASADAEKH